MTTQADERITAALGSNSYRPQHMKALHLIVPVGFHISHGQHEIEPPPPTASHIEGLGQFLEMAMDIPHERESGSRSLLQAKKAASPTITQISQTPEHGSRGNVVEQNKEKGPCPGCCYSDNLCQSPRRLVVERTNRCCWLIVRPESPRFAVDNMVGETEGVMPNSDAALERIRSTAPSTTVQGRRFERMMRTTLLNHPGEFR